jgi:transcription antitermination protein NusB
MNEKTQHANPNKSRTPRHRAREFALQGLYQWIMNKDEVSRVIEHVQAAHGFEKADLTLFTSLMHGTIKQADVLREQLAPLIDRSLDELSPIEHAILLIGAFELINLPEVPYRVVINEAVELTKSFGGIDGHKYVNGVLDKLAAKVRAPEVSKRHG